MELIFDSIIKALVSFFGWGYIMNINFELKFGYLLDRNCVCILILKLVDVREINVIVYGIL